MKIETQKAMHDEVADAVLEVLERRDWQDVDEMLDRSMGRLAFAGQVADRAVERLAAARLEGEEVVAEGYVHADTPNRLVGAAEWKIPVFSYDGGNRVIPVALVRREDTEEG